MKMNSKGFTLIELLAVITIMGILMLVAIPAISRTIENSRRDTFADVAQTYVNAVRNAVLADELQCSLDPATPTNKTNVAATPIGTYYFKIDNRKTSSDTTVKGQTTDLMESGGFSSWGNAGVVGYVKWVKTAHAAGGASGGEANETQTKYSIVLVDDGGHGIDKDKPGEDQAIKRTSVQTSGAEVGSYPSGSGTYECTLG